MDDHGGSPDRAVTARQLKRQLRLFRCVGPHRNRDGDDPTAFCNQQASWLEPPAYSHTPTGQCTTLQLAGWLARAYMPSVCDKCDHMGLRCRLAGHTRWSSVQLLSGGKSVRATIFLLIFERQAAENPDPQPLATPHILPLLSLTGSLSHFHSVPLPMIAQPQPYLLGPGHQGRVGVQHSVSNNSRTSGFIGCRVGRVPL